jgi:bis(5'-adenosyl)-triphosphatase
MKNILDKKCAFCQKDVQENNFAESENFLAIYNVAPILPGHSLIIPRWHVHSLMELSEQELCEMTVFARNVVKVLMKAFGHTAYNWTIQEGVEAGQTVPHLHLHLIPRKERDLPQPGDWYPLLEQSEIELIDSDARPKISFDEMKVIATKLKATAKEVFSE